MKSKIIIIILILLIISGAVGYFFISRPANKKQEVVFNKIEKLQQIVSVKQIYREVIYSKESQDILWIPLLNKEFLISLDYIITAGIDLSKGFNVYEKNGSIKIALPKAQIISIDADDSSINEYFIKERFSKLNRDDYFKLIKDSKESILLGDNIENLLNQSEENAKKMLISLFQVVEIPVEISFSDSVIKDLK